MSVPVYVAVGEHFIERLSTVFFPRDFIELLEHLEKKLGYAYPMLHAFFMGEEVAAAPLLDEAMELLLLLKHRAEILPPVFFFAVLPRDFDDVASIIGGGASSMLIPTPDGVCELHGGFKKAIMVRGHEVKNLKAGDELLVGGVRVKVFTRSPYEAVIGPLKTLIVAALIASRAGLKLRALGLPEAAGTAVVAGGGAATS